MATVAFHIHVEHAGKKRHSSEVSKVQVGGLAESFAHSSAWSYILVGGYPAPLEQFRVLLMIFDSVLRTVLIDSG